MTHDTTAESWSVFRTEDFDRSVVELARQRDEAEVRLMRALDESPA